MRIPQPILSEIQAALSRHFGHDAEVLSATPLGGSCISPAARVQTAAGARGTTRGARGEGAGCHRQEWGW